MNKREAAIISAYTGFMCGAFSDMHKYTEELLGRPILTHEFGNERFAKLIKKRSKPDFITICEELEDTQ